MPSAEAPVPSAEYRVKGGEAKEPIAIALLSAKTLRDCRGRSQGFGVLALQEKH